MYRRSYEAAPVANAVREARKGDVEMMFTRQGSSRKLGRVARVVAAGLALGSIAPAARADLLTGGVIVAPANPLAGTWKLTFTPDSTAVDAGRYEFDDY